MSATASTTEPAGGGTVAHGRRAPLRGRLVHPVADGVVYGPGTVRSDLAGLLGRVGGRRPFVVTTPSVVRAGLVDVVTEAIGGGVAGVFAGSREHTPAPVVLEAAAAARDADADSLVSLGGSSVVDLTKGIALVLAEGEDLEALRIRFAPGEAAQRPRLNQPKLPHIAIPTTLSGAEFTGGVGITDPVQGHKALYGDAKLTPRWVVLDPELARATPAALWSATGMKVVSDTLEVLSSRRATPLSDAVALGALGLLAAELPAATADADDVGSRGRCLFAVAMALPQLALVGVGLVAAIRHQLGGALGVGHGVASTIVLPHVLRWNAAVPAASDAQRRAAATLGVEPTPEALVERVVALTREVGLPARLRDVGVQRDDLRAVAAHTIGDQSIATNPRPVEAADDVLALLEAAW
jgi:alcohol dehydrogenase class IV